MALIEFEDGLVVDDATGEVIDVPGGASEDALTTLLVARLHGAKTMKREHERDVAALTATLLNRLDGKGLYGDLMASVRADTFEQLDRDALRAWVGDADLTREDALALLACVSAFEKKALSELPAHIADAINDFYVKREKGAWIDTRPVKRAPGRIKEEVTA